MKKLFNILAISLPLMMTSSCGDFLEVEPQNIITIDQFWNEESDVESMVLGCYNRMQQGDVMRRMLVWGEFRSENIVSFGPSIEKDRDLDRLLKENITAMNGYTTWTGFYDVINRCNIIIEFAHKVAENDPSYTEGELKAHIAEATALRSLCYFYLIRTFRDVPYSEEALLDDGQTLAQPALPFAEVLKKLIASLEAVKDDAVSRYPETNTQKNYNSGRFTKVGIYALLCELYLWDKDYDNCIKMADYVIEQKTIRAQELDATEDWTLTNGYPLIKSRKTANGTTFGKAFTNIFVKGCSQEGILELVFDKNAGNSQISNDPVHYFYGNAADEASYVRASDYVGTDIKSSKPAVFLNKYDGRLYENIRFSRGGDPVSINKYVTSTEVSFGDPTTGTFYEKAYWGVKYPVHVDDKTHDKTSLNKSNFIIYRLTDIMLLKAEALTQKMSDADVMTDTDKAYRDKAFELVNAVNKRSILRTSFTSPTDTLQLSSFPNKSTITDLVYDERNRELMFEGKRYFDLVRRSQRDGNTDYLRSKAKNKSVENSSIVESQLQRMDAIYWPYNLEETRVNPYLVQNPAFGTGESSSFDNAAK
ncbi:MAG: RagB/SusD family nutrient uptake outer membrane protein [Bacteroidales bacterium]|nr:RagB/SusD family nutrient uptake outer membrane protein [Candidatus Liminaster caballi]